MSAGLSVLVWRRRWSGARGGGGDEEKSAGGGEGEESEGGRGRGCCSRTKPIRLKARCSGRRGGYWQLGGKLKLLGAERRKVS